MAASTSRGGDRMIHQDYIARIRYSNTLPPPPNPPKLLEIPNTGLSSGQYTTPGFASRLAREQPLNIEADAELGMPLDLVGMPGVFDGDESSIQAPLYPPAPHPHDRLLLRPLNLLGKPKTSESGVSFLRRTEYISSHTSKSRFDSTTSKSLINSTGTKVKRLPNNVDKESPEYILAAVERSFEVAARYLEEPSTLRHPTKYRVKLIESYPILPDLAAIPETGGYVTVKFQNNPVPPSNVYDTRLTSGILRPLAPSDERAAAHQEAIAAHERDPEHNPHPGPDQDYEYYMTEKPSDARNFKRKADVLDPERDEESLYTFTNGEGIQCFRYKRVRAYETAAFEDMGLLGPEARYNNELILALNNGDEGDYQKAAYYYPTIMRCAIRPQRSKNIDRLRYNQAGEDDTMIDLLDVRVRDPTDAEDETRARFAEQPYFVTEAAEEHEEAEEAYAADGDDQAEDDQDGDEAANAQLNGGESDDE